MDARMPVTHKEGDRYPLDPPNCLLVGVATSRNPSVRYVKSKLEP